MGADRQQWFARQALLPGGLASDVTFEISSGRFTQVTPRTEPDPNARHLPGVAIPGLANAHSRCIHRALRGRTHAGARAQWASREKLAALTRGVTPDDLRTLATAVFAEMALAGITTVGEFHYLHHDRDGRAYADPNVMTKALVEAAATVGIRITVFDVLYLSGGLTPQGHFPLGEVQVRFGDPSADRWVTRVTAMPESNGMRLGVAVPSVGQVAKPWLSRVRDVAVSSPQARRREIRLPVQATVSGSRDENEASQGYYDCSPTRVLLDEGLIDSTFSAVHATHLSEQDLRILGQAGAGAICCPTSERESGRGLGPAARLNEAGLRLALGSDRQVAIDPFEEVRAIEMNVRTSSDGQEQLGLHALRMALSAHDTVGWPEAGALRPGALADIVTVRLDSVRTAGIDPAQVLFSATAADVSDVAVAGRFIVEDGRHHLGDVAGLLSGAIGPLWDRSR